MPLAEGLGERHTVVRYDERGCGLSGTEIGDPSVEVWVGDLETVVDAAGLERFALLGVSQGAAIAVAYAARHPDRVSHLVLYGGYARGRRFRGEGEEEDAIVAAIRAGWTAPNPAFRRMFSMLFLPDGAPEQMAWHEDLLRRSTTAETAARLYRARGGVNVCELAPQGRCAHPCHARAGRSSGPGREEPAARRADPGRALWSCWSPRITSCSSRSRRGMCSAQRSRRSLARTRSPSPPVAVGDLSMLSSRCCSSCRRA